MNFSAYIFSGLCLSWCLCTSAYAADRIVSLDYCADQYVLKFARKSSVVGLSPDGAKSFSYMREHAKGLPVVRPIAEDVLIRKPDLVVRSYGGSPGIVALLKRFNIPVLQLGYIESLADVRRTILQVSLGLSNPEAGQEVVKQMDASLRAIEQASSVSAEKVKALYMTPGGVTGGPNTLVHDILRAAGLNNYQSESGWQDLPLEKLIFDSPDLIAMAFFETLSNHPDAWSVMRHPVARRQLKEVGAVPLQGAWTACGGWFLVDAIESLYAALLPQGKTPKYHE